MLVTFGKAGKPPKSKKGKDEKFEKVMTEFKAGTLHSGGKDGPIVTDKKQALAIAASAAGVSYKKAMMPSDIVFLMSHMESAELVELSKSYYGPDVAKVSSATKMCYSSAVDSALYQMCQGRLALTDADIVSKIDTLKLSLAVMPDGDVKNMVMGRLDTLKAMKTMDDDTIYKTQDVIRSLIRVTMDLEKSVNHKFLHVLRKAGLVDKVDGEYVPFAKADPDRAPAVEGLKPSELKKLVKANYIKREGSPGHYKYTYAEFHEGKKEGEPGHHEYKTKNGPASKPKFGPKEYASDALVRGKKADEVVAKLVEAYDISKDEAAKAVAHALKKLPKGMNAEG